MVRTVIIPTSTDVHISIDKEYVGKPIEITYLALDELEHKNSSTKKLSDLAGSLSKTTADELLKHVEDSRKEWQ